jgi:glutamate/aspartate transport system permease protein
MLDLNWNFLLEFDPNSGGVIWKIFVAGLWNTLKLCVSAWVLAMLLGVIVGAIRTCTVKMLVGLGDGFSEIFRNIPLIVQMFMWFFVVPIWIPAFKSVDYSTYQFIAATLALGLFTAARVSEQIRAAIMAMPRGQRSAADALGLKGHQVYRYILLPISLRICIPSLTSDTMSLIKNSTVALTIGYAELMFRSVKEVAEINFRFFEVYVILTCIYIFVSMCANRVMRHVEHRMAIPGFIVSKA